MFPEGVSTIGERSNKVVEIWGHVTGQIADQLFKEMEVRAANGDFNPFFMMADSGARGSKEQIRQLAGMRGLMAKPSGEASMYFTVPQSYWEMIRSLATSTNRLVR